MLATRLQYGERQTTITTEASLDGFFEYLENDSDFESHEQVKIGEPVFINCPGKSKSDKFAYLKRSTIDLATRYKGPSRKRTKKQKQKATPWGDMELCEPLSFCPPPGSALTDTERDYIVNRALEFVSPDSPAVAVWHTDKPYLLGGVWTTKDDLHIIAGNFIDGAKVRLRVTQLRKKYGNDYARQVLPNFCAKLVNELNLTRAKENREPMISLSEWMDIAERQRLIAKVAEIAKDADPKWPNQVVERLRGAGWEVQFDAKIIQVKAPEGKKPTEMVLRDFLRDLQLYLSQRNRGYDRDWAKKKETKSRSSSMTKTQDLPPNRKEQLP